MSIKQYALAVANVAMTYDYPSEEGDFTAFVCKTLEHFRDKNSLGLLKHDDYGVFAVKVINGEMSIEEANKASVAEELMRLETSMNNLLSKLRNAQQNTTERFVTSVEINQLEGKLNDDTTPEEYEGLLKDDTGFMTKDEIVAKYEKEITDQTALIEENLRSNIQLIKEKIEAINQELA